MAVAKEVSKHLNIESNDFIKGNLLPDIIDTEDSHHIIQGKIYLIPDIEYFKQTLDLSNELQLGYLVHLLLDKYYLEEFLPSKYPGRNIFIDKEVYKDYDKLNIHLVRHFNLDPKELEIILSTYPCNIKKDKLHTNIECLKKKENGETKYITLDDFIKFLTQISIKISEEILNIGSKKYKKENKNEK